MTHPFESLPRRIFLDSCTAQTLRNYGGYIYEAEPIPASDRIYRVTDGIANVEALRDIFLVNERALFEWIVSRASMQEARDKGDPGHMQWLWDIADHSEICLEGDGPDNRERWPSPRGSTSPSSGISVRRTGCSSGTRSFCAARRS